jgi:hypothetical protein
MCGVKGRGGYRKSIGSEIYMKLVRSTSELIKSVDFKLRSRKKASYFTRKCKMPFHELMSYTLNSYNCSIRSGLSHFFPLVEKKDISMKQPSYSKSRKKVKNSAFKEIFDKSVDVLSKSCKSTWHGFLIFAIDGTKIALPQDKKLLKAYGGTGANASSPTAQGSIMYDILNNIVYDAFLGPLDADERTLAIKHLKTVSERLSGRKMLVIFDRGYPSFELIQILEELGITYLMRVKTKFNNAIDAQTEPDGYVQLVKNADSLNVRVIKFKLKSGELEMLITNLYDGRLGVNAFKKLYFMRWPIETKYDIVKNKLNIENFSSRTISGVKQDFYASMYLTNAVAAAAHDAQPRADAERLGKNNKYEYRININEAIGTLKRHFISLLFKIRTKEWAKEIDDFLNEVASNVVPVRPNRSVKRNLPRKAKFHYNRKCNSY